MALAVADELGLTPRSPNIGTQRLSTPSPTRPVNREIDGLTRRLQSESILARVADELRIDLVNPHPDKLILGG